MIDKIKVGATNDSKGNTYTTGTNFTGREFENAYLNYNIPDLQIANCSFKGVCYIKNIGGTITYTGTNIGGIVISNKPIPEGTVVGFGDVDPDFF